MARRGGSLWKWSGRLAGGSCFACFGAADAGWGRGRHRVQAGWCRLGPYARARVLGVLSVPYEYSVQQMHGTVDKPLHAREKDGNNRANEGRRLGAAAACSSLRGMPGGNWPDGGVPGSTMAPRPRSYNVRSCGHHYRDDTDWRIGGFCAALVSRWHATRGQISPRGMGTMMGGWDGWMDIDERGEASPPGATCRRRQEQARTYQLHCTA